MQKEKKRISVELGIMAFRLAWWIVVQIIAVKGKNSVIDLSDTSK